jgi:hypothetical protein
MKYELIAPCGINCAICVAYFGYTMSGAKRKRSCLGCRQRNNDVFLERTKCAFLKKHCKLLANEKVRFCFECAEYPCAHLEKLDHRYRKNYNMSPIENLNSIRDCGMKKFLDEQLEKYKCSTCGGTICVHTGLCYNCSIPQKID